MGPLARRLLLPIMAKGINHAQCCRRSAAEDHERRGRNEEIEIKPCSAYGCEDVRRLWEYRPWASSSTPIHVIPLHDKIWGPDSLALRKFTLASHTPTAK